VIVAPSEPYPSGERHVAEVSAVAPVVLLDGGTVRTPEAPTRLGARLGEVGRPVE
jgi:hypothetical protein